MLKDAQLKTTKQRTSLRRKSSSVTSQAEMLSEGRQAEGSSKWASLSPLKVLGGLGRKASGKKPPTRAGAAPSPLGRKKSGAASKAFEPVHV